MSFYVYILASRRNGTLYVGHTDDLIRRVWQHKTEELRGFTSQYGVKHLVWFEHGNRAFTFPLIPAKAGNQDDDKRSQPTTVPARVASTNCSVESSMARPRRPTGRWM